MNQFAREHMMQIVKFARAMRSASQELTRNPTAILVELTVVPARNAQKIPNVLLYQQQDLLAKLMEVLAIAIAVLIRIVVIPYQGATTNSAKPATPTPFALV